jgi:S-adenosylmethionine decarboxylase
MAFHPARQVDPAPWGYLTSLDVHGCNPESIRDAGKIKEFVRGLCERIDMRPFGECQVVHFGRDERVEGYSMVQFIETSLISGHFANLTNTAYIDIFSCKPYDPDQAARYTREFFGAVGVRHHLLRRGEISSI